MRLNCQIIVVEIIAIIKQIATVEFMRQRKLSELAISDITLHFSSCSNYTIEIQP